MLSLISFALLWEVAARIKNAQLLPPLSKVLSAWVELLVSGQLFQALLVSLQALFLGFLLSVGLGLPLGLLMGRYRKVASFLDIYMTALLAVPMISFIPFLVIAFGLGLHSRVWIVFLFAFVIITINTAAGVRHLDPTLTEMARAFCAREDDVFLEGFATRRSAHDHGRDSAWNGTRYSRYGNERNDFIRCWLWGDADDLRRFVQHARALCDITNDRAAGRCFVGLGAILRPPADA